MNNLYKSSKLNVHMFNKKIKCTCGKKIDKKFEFCPYCGRDIQERIIYEKARDKQVNAIMKDFEKAFDMPFIMKFPFESLVKKMVKDIDKQFQEYDNELSKEKGPKVIRTGLSISINSTPEGEPIIKVRQLGGNNVQYKDESMENIKEKEKKLPKIQDKQAEKISKLPKQEPEKTVRRLTDRIIYEISLPGVKDDKNLFIEKLQNSIEVRAFSDKQAYFKLIPVPFLIKNWKLEKEKLILELRP